MMKNIQCKRNRKCKLIKLFSIRIANINAYFLLGNDSVFSFCILINDIKILFYMIKYNEKRRIET